MTLDVERLTRALWNGVQPARHWLDAETTTYNFARWLAAEYERLGPPADGSDMSDRNALPVSVEPSAGVLTTAEVGHLQTQLVLRAGHLPDCGEGAEFPWDCTCDYAGFMERMGLLLGRFAPVESESP